MVLINQYVDLVRNVAHVLRTARFNSRVSPLFDSIWYSFTFGVLKFSNFSGISDLRSQFLNLNFICCFCSYCCPTCTKHGSSNPEDFNLTRVYLSISLLYFVSQLKSFALHNSFSSRDTTQFSFKYCIWIIYLINCAINHNQLFETKSVKRHPISPNLTDDPRTYALNRVSLTSSQISKIERFLFSSASDKRKIAKRFSSLLWKTITFMRNVSHDKAAL